MTLVMVLAFAFTAVADPPPTTFADSVQAAYASEDADALVRLCERARDRKRRLLCRYRLYPLTEDARYVDDLPEPGGDTSARELALLSGLWGYRAARGGLATQIRTGRQAQHLLDRSRALDADDPYVLLVGGQSLLFRPGIFGGDDEAALARFRRLEEVVRRRPNGGVSMMEVQTWIWYTLREMDAPEAATLREALLKRDPAPLYHAFLTADT